MCGTAYECRADERKKKSLQEVHEGVPIDSIPKLPQQSFPREPFLVFLRFKVSHLFPLPPSSPLFCRTYSFSPHVGKYGCRQSTLRIVVKVVETPSRAPVVSAPVSTDRQYPHRRVGSALPGRHIERDYLDGVNITSRWQNAAGKAGAMISLEVREDVVIRGINHGPQPLAGKVMSIIVALISACTLASLFGQ